MQQQIVLDNMPKIDGVTFRGFLGEVDYPAMVTILKETDDFDQIKQAITLEDIQRSYSHLTNCDPYQDMLFAEADADQVAGMVLNFIDARENEEYGRKRGYTQSISVRRPWRRRGLARSLIAQSFHLLRDLGMEEAALGVDTQNLSEAFRLYEGLGFKKVKRWTDYRKPLEA